MAQANKVNSETKQTYSHEFKFKFISNGATHNFAYFEPKKYSSKLINFLVRTLHSTETLILHFAH